MEALVYIDENFDMNTLKPKEPGRYLCLIISHKKHRSQAQNKLYHGLLTAISNHTGYTKDELHDIYMNWYAQWFDSSTKMPEDLFSNYIREIQIHAYNHFNIIYPPINIG